MSRMMILFQIEVYPQRWQRYQLLSDFTSVEKSSPMQRVSLIRFSLLFGSLNPLSCSKFTLRSQAHRAEYEEILLGVQGDDQCKRLSSQFIGRWELFSFEILENCISTLVVEMTSFFSTQVLPPLPRPLPAVYRRNARPVRGRQHHDQDAGVMLFYFAALLF